MARYGKREKPKCPVCGKEMTFLSKTLLADGAICQDCTAMLRGRYDIENYWTRHYDGTYRQRFSDPIHGLTTEDVRAIIAQKREEQAMAASAYGDRFPHLFKVDDTFVIAPRVTKVGVKRSKRLRDKCVVRGMVLIGEFRQGDTVTVIESGGEADVEVLELIPCGGASSFDTELEAAMHKKTAPAETNAWLILDRSEPLAVGTLIGRP